MRARLLPLAVGLASSFVAALSLAAPAESAGRFTVATAISARSAVVIGTSFQITGGVSPASPGSPVVLQRLVAGKWRNVSSVPASRASRFAFRQVVPAAGATNYRVVKTSANKVAAGTGAVVRAVGLKPAVTLTLPSSQVDAGSGIAPSYTVTNLPVGGSVVAQRTFGTAAVFQDVATLGTAPSGTGAFAAPGQGAYRVRAAVRYGKQIVAASAQAPLYAYSDVSMATASGRGTETNDISGTLFRYVFSNGYGSSSEVIKWDATSCRSASFQAAKGPVSEGYTDQGPGKVSVIQENADPYTLTVPAAQTVTGNVVLTGSAVSIQVADQVNSDGSTTYLNGTFSCYTPTGTP